MELYKEIFKVVNGAFIISTWLCNYLFMFYYKPMIVILTELGILLFINILAVIICFVLD